MGREPNTAGTRTVLDGRYELHRMPLARGGMGAVWEGHDTRLDREVAVKFVRFPAGVVDDDLVRRFVRESRITARLQHPGVPAVFDAGTHEDTPFLVMQRVHGISVSDLVAEHGQLPIGWACALAAQTCAVLSVAHRASLVHRDLKPANLMLEPDGTVKVLDFGLAVGLDLTDTSRITRTGESLGTPAYMAPEQVNAGMSTPQTDLYALGCTLHEMLTGDRVFTGPTDYAVMSKQVGEPPPEVRELRPEVPAGLAELVAALLEKETENRPADADETYQRLLPFVTDLTPIPGVLHPPNLPSPTRMQATVLSRVFPTTAPAEASTAAGSTTTGSTATGSAAPPDSPAGADIAPASGTADPGEPATGEAGSHHTAPHLERSELARARSAAESLAADSRYRQAAEVLETTVGRAGAAFGDTDPDVLDLRNDWANTLFEGGDYRRAAPAYEALAEDVAHNRGPDDELAFRCRLQHATCHALTGDTSYALEILHGLLDDERRVYGPDDERPLELRRQIGLLQLGAGQHRAAEHTLSELRADLVRIHGDDHPTVARIDQLLTR